MASPEALRILRELQSKPENRVCCDCETKNPQWASVSLSCFFCLECSGRHRGLGVHISFVRSVTMDSWSNDQLKKMQLGGNGRLVSFLKQYGIDKTMDIKDKYNSQAAEVYRQLLRAEFEGRPYSPPPPSSVPPPTPGGGSGGRVQSNAPPSRGGAGSPAPKTKSNMDDWGDWGDSKAAGNGSGGFSSGSEYTKSALEASAAQKDSFFARKMAENANKPEGLPPSQGGKYVGFGSQSNSNGGSNSYRNNGAGGVDDVTAMFSSGLTSLGRVAGTVAETAMSTVKAGSRSLQEKPVTEVVSQNAKVIGEKAAVVAQTGWTGLKSFYATVASTVETAAKQQGYSIDLGSKAVARTVGPSGEYDAMDSQGQYGGQYGGGYQDDSGGARGYGSGHGGGGSGPASTRNGTGGGGGRSNGNGNFAGFDDGADNSGWNEWEDDGWSNGNKGMGHKSQSTPALKNSSPAGRTGMAHAASSSRMSGAGNGSARKQQVDDDDQWGKW